MRGPDNTSSNNPVIPMVTPRKRKGAKLQVPLSMYLNAMVCVDCPELTAPDAPMTQFHGQTKEEAEAARDKAIKIAKELGKPIYTGKVGKARRRQWVANGFSA